MNPASPGETFTSVPVERRRVGEYGVIRNRITGTAYVTGTAGWSIDPMDPLRDRFLLLD